MGMGMSVTVAMAVAERQAAESSVESKGSAELAGMSGRVVLSVGFVEGINLLQEGFEEVVIHVGLLPFWNHLCSKLFAKLHI